MQRRPPTRHIVSRAVACALFFALPALASPKPAGSAAITLPTQPRALLALGARSNGFSSLRDRPWHIKVTYQTYTPEGRRKATGTFQEWWAAPNQYRLSFARRHYHLQAWVTPHGSYAIGNPNLPMPERLVYHWIVAPIPRHPDLAGAKLWYRVRLIGPLQFPCVQIRSPKPSPNRLPPQYPIYCFEPNHPMLRIMNSRVAEGVTVTTVGSLRGHYVAQSFIAALNGLPILTARLLQGESYTRISPAIFTPPASAKPAPPPSTALLYLTAREAATHLIPSSIPHTSSLAFLRHSQVYVPLAASIGIHGHVHHLRILGSTDPMLIPAIYQVVSHWRYRPFLLHGHPAAVRTRIILDYRRPLPR